MANFWCGMQCLAVQMSSLVSSAMWKWIRIRMFSCRKQDVISRTADDPTFNVNRRVLQNTRRHRPWCRAETAARPGTSWRARCGRRQTAGLSRCCTETERRCSGDREGGVRGSSTLVQHPLVHTVEWFSPSERRRCTSPPYIYESSAAESFAGRCPGATEPERARERGQQRRGSKHQVTMRCSGPIRARKGCSNQGSRFVNLPFIITNDWFPS